MILAYDSVLPHSNSGLLINKCAHECALAGRELGSTPEVEWSEMVNDV